MVLLETPICDFDRKAKDFSLQGVDNKNYTLNKIRGSNGTLVMFICNHCPYVKAVQRRLVRDVQELQKLDIGVIAIMSNDPKEYAEDSFENMKIIAKREGFTFPYVFDETQSVAKAYGAICTPDFFGYNANLKLQYRGRLDASGNNAFPGKLRSDLLEGMKQVVETGFGPKNQIPSIGCSIKWRSNS
jgi:peroxiredoxin